MPRIAIADAEVWNQAKKPTKGYENRAEMRKALEDLDEEQVLELTPDTDESVRKLKVMTKWAAKEIGKEVRYAETADGTLLVRLGAPKTQSAYTGARRGRPPRQEPAEES